MKLLRGRIAVREIHAAQFLWTPDEGPRQVRTHRGVVLALGAPPIQYFANGSSYEIPYRFGAGDVIQYHFTHHQEAWTMPWPDDGELATWVPQAFVDGVVE
jgi:hypothetical protein